MPTFRDPIPQGFQPFRVHAVTVHATWTKFFCVPEFEIGVLKSGWRGSRIEVQSTNDIVHVEENADTVFRRLCAKYGEDHVRRYHAGPERLSEDMERQSREAREWIAKAIATEEAEEKRRLNAERAARAAANAEKLAEAPQKKAG
ncbi:MAG: hypothetical protein RL513_453 [Pseudomonadota bacterium]|jgi:hypothetical protein